LAASVLGVVAPTFMAHAVPFERVRVISETINKEAKGCGLSREFIVQAAEAVFRDNKVENVRTGQRE
jgi:hypothetical protein